MRIVVAMLAGLWLCVGHGAAPPAPAFTLVDLTGEYTAFFDRTRDTPPAARVDAFKVAFAAVLPAFYSVDRWRTFATADRFDAQIARSFEAFPELRARYVRTAESFQAMLAPARDDFARHFPDLAPIGDVYLLHSLGEMDGGTRTIGGRRYLVFGADVMARLYAPGEARPFFQHELFHVYHDQFFAGCGSIGCALWREGLAVHVSEALNPGATDAELGLTMPRPIRAEVEANLPAAVCAVRARLRSERREDYAPLFTGGAQLDGLPPRFAYYVGYLVARHAARTRSLQELARLPPSDAIPLVETTLAGLADCATRG